MIFPVGATNQQGGLGACRVVPESKRGCATSHIRQAVALLGKRVARPRSLTTIMSVEIRYAAATANRFRCSSRSGVFPAYLVTTRQDPSH